MCAYRVKHMQATILAPWGVVTANRMAILSVHDRAEPMQATVHRHEGFEREASLSEG